MSEFNRVKLGKRLSRIETMVAVGYDHIWDCCCDHGLLGMLLLEKRKAGHLHFVDIVPNLLIEIEKKLNRYYQGKDHWSVHCLDVAMLPIQQYKQEKHLVIIAGVGGELLVEFLTTLLPLTAKLNIEFLLSPVHHTYQLRSFLIKQNCSLLSEKLIEENNRFYEVLLISNKEGASISPVGEQMWNLNCKKHQCYLHRTINHYQRIAKNPNIDVTEIIAAYQRLTSN